MIHRQKTFSAALVVAAGLILLVTACGSSEPVGLDGGEPASGGTAAAATEIGAETQPGDAETQLASDGQVGEGESASGAESEQPAPDGAETASAETTTGDAATAEEEAAQAGGGEAAEEPESGAVAMAAAPPPDEPAVREPNAAKALVPNEPAEEPEPADEPDDRPLGLAGTQGGSGPTGGGGDESFLQRVLGAVSNVPGAVLNAVADVSPIALYGGLGGILVLGGAGGFLMIKKFRAPSLTG